MMTEFSLWGNYLTAYYLTNLVLYRSFRAVTKDDVLCFYTGMQNISVLYQLLSIIYGSLVLNYKSVVSV